MPDLDSKKISSYMLNCFLLLIPIFLWDLIFVNSLPRYYSDASWDAIPTGIMYAENILKIGVFTFPIVMQFSLKTKKQKLGFGLYLLGIIVYFSSWAAQIYFPESAWSISLPGRMAPAYTTLPWFIGIGLIGNKTFFKLRLVSLGYILLSIVFVVFHSLHAYFAFS